MAPAVVRVVLPHEAASSKQPQLAGRLTHRQSKATTSPPIAVVQKQSIGKVAQPSPSPLLLSSTDPVGSPLLVVGRRKAQELVLLFSFFFVALFFVRHQDWYIPNASTWIMRLFGNNRSALGLASVTTSSSAGADPHHPRFAAPAPSRAVIEAALWAFFAGDALSSPTHWYYGGLPQIQQHYGSRGITGYTRPVMELPGSILNKSNLAGGGRTTPIDKMHDLIIGQIINHGKHVYWDPTKNIHYHATLAAGEPTLEAQLARVLMASLVAYHGRFDADDFRTRYVQFMTTAGSHNDTYASTCHRMFFANYHYRHLPPIDCPDNDRHNVDTIDGLVLPTITALAVAGRPDGTVDEARRDAAATAAVTRRSDVLAQYAAAWGQLVYRVVRDRAVPTIAVDEMRRELRLPASNGNLMTACYLEAAVPSLLAMIVDFDNTTTTTTTTAQPPNNARVWRALLRNANVGGENVHRGSCLGAILGAVAGTVGDELKQGLYPSAAIAEDVRAFAAAVIAAEVNDNRDNNKSSSSSSSTVMDGTTTTKRAEV